MVKCQKPDTALIKPRKALQATCSVQRYELLHHSFLASWTFLSVVVVT